MLDSLEDELSLDIDDTELLELSLLIELVVSDDSDDMELIELSLLIVVLDSDDMDDPLDSDDNER